MNSLMHLKLNCATVFLKSDQSIQNEFLFTQMTDFLNRTQSANLGKQL